MAADLQTSWRTRVINPKFHYQSYQQANYWLRLHRAFSPTQTDPEIAALYDKAFAAAASSLAASQVHVIGLGCGSAQKETRGLQILRQNHPRPVFTAVDVSAPLALSAYASAREWADVAPPIICDLMTADDAADLAGQQTPANAGRLLTFFGMLPNCEPDRVKALFTRVMRPTDKLLLSANLAPGQDYMEGVQRVLPQYDNAATRDWLMLFLNDLGVSLDDGQMEWSVEKASFGNLRRIVAWFEFRKPHTVECEGESFRFAAGDRIRLFYSYRYTVALVTDLIARAGLLLENRWISSSGEEGVFLVRTNE